MWLVLGMAVAGERLGPLTWAELEAFEASDQTVAEATATRSARLESLARLKDLLRTSCCDCSADTRAEMLLRYADLNQDEGHALLLEDRVDLLLAVGLARFDRGDHAGALDDLRRVAAVPWHPAAPYAAYVAGHAALALGDVSEARVWLEQAVDARQVVVSDHARADLRALNR